MTSKNIFISIVITLIIIAAIYGGMTLIKSDVTVSPSPSPSASAILFNSTEGSVLQQPSPSVTSSPKTMKQYQSFPKLTGDKLKNKKAIIETGKGKIEFEIYPEATQASSSFIFLASEKFFDGLTFHRVEDNFVIQGGDPLGNGTGGPGYKFADDRPITRDYKKGTVAMANSGPNTNGSQFFICLEDLPTLPKNYTIFGVVTSGIDTVEKITKGDKMQRIVVQDLK